LEKPTLEVTALCVILEHIDSVFYDLDVVL